ncbi:DMT family transporter [Ferrimicrobium sp.]|uniref:DMT family transporter n=1 Tax=Ferrimicrobium sp. TaxID=2926050 RepID=UPI002625EBBC|nr:DMT family transporter [Ferrimicrobium sp.]
MKASTQGFIALALASAIWGGMYVASDALMRTMPPLVVLEFREGVSAIILLFIAARSRQLHVARRDYLPMFGVGVIGFSVSIGFQFYGTHAAGAALGSLVTASSPILIALLGAFILKEHVPLRRWLAIALAFVGVIVIVGTPAPGKDTTLGVSLLLVAAVCWSLYTIGSTSLLNRYSALTVVTIACTVGAITSLPFASFAYLHARHPLPMNLAQWGEVLYISVIGMALAFFLWVWGFKHVSASRGGVLLLFQPLVGIILGVVLLGETITIGTLAGAILVCVGVTLAVLERKPPLALEPTP